MQNYKLMLAMLILSTQGSLVVHVFNIKKHGAAVEKVVEKARFFYILAAIFLLSAFLFSHSGLRYDFYTFGFLFTKITVQLQISHVLNKDYTPERMDTLAVTMVWLLSIGARVVSGNPAHVLAAVAMWLSIADCLRFCFVLARRMARLLGINVLFYTEKAKLKAK